MARSRSLPSRYYTNLSTLLTNEGYNDDEIVQEIGISRRTLSKYRYGHCIIPYKKRQAFAHLLRLSVTEIICVPIDQGILVPSGNEIQYLMKPRETVQKFINTHTGDIGLNTYDPDQPMILDTSQPITKFLDLAQYLIHRSEVSYCQSPLPDATRDIAVLHNLFEWLRTQYPPPPIQEQRFLTLYSQVKNLDGVILLGNGQYVEAYRTFQEMLEITRSLSDRTMQAHALLTVGTELGRMGKKHEAVSYLESARDLTFFTSREVVAYVQAYLARAYAEAGEWSRSERAIQTALQAPDHYGNGENFVYHSLCGLLAEESHIHLIHGQPEKVLAMYERMEQQAKQDGNKRVETWIPYDAARAHEMLGNLEECVHFARAFFYLAEEMQAFHPRKRSIEFVEMLSLTYKDVAPIRNLYAEIRQKVHDDTFSGS